MNHHAVLMLGVSEAHNYTAGSSAVSVYGYRAYGELARFTYCLLQKINAAHSLPLIKKWENYMFPNHLRFPPIEEKGFLYWEPIYCGAAERGQFLLAERVPES